MTDPIDVLDLAADRKWLMRLADFHRDRYEGEHGSMHDELCDLVDDCLLLNSVLVAEVKHLRSLLPGGGDA